MNDIRVPHPRILRIDAAAIRDAAGCDASPGSLLLDLESPVLRDGRWHARARVLASGPSAAVDTHPASAHAARLARPDTLLIPGLVNAHTHLDLTHIGPVEHDPATGFIGFVETVRARRHTEQDAIAESVRGGVAASLGAGVVAVGDIAGAVMGRPCTAGVAALAASPLRGVSYLEFFAIGLAERPSLDRVAAAVPGARSLATPRVRVGLQPHAPYSVSPRAYAFAADLAARDGLPLATHLAETPDEAEFIARGTGPNRAFQERLGIWTDDELTDFSAGRRPIEHLAGVLARGKFLAAHVNHATDTDVEILRRAGTIVAYCPRASAYFGAERAFGPHRYRAMLAAGVPVALGTDSVLNLPTRALSVLDEMRWLRRRDGTDPGTLLAMGTLHGAAALGLDPSSYTFTPGAELAGLNAVQMAPGTGGPLARALASPDAPELLLLGS